MARTLRTFIFVLGLVTLAAACAGEDLPGGDFPDASSGTGDCGPGNCAGCCTPEGSCITNVWDRQCGSGGAACTDCAASGEACTEQGQCQAPPGCDASNCPNGCCDGDECIEPADDEQACGTRGNECQTCDAELGHVCDGETCRAPCGPDTCTGCCVDEFTCLEEPDERACGAGGSQCEDCGVDGVCSDGGECLDDSCANTCDGCCTEDGECIENTSNQQCGVLGELCTDCAANDEICANPGVCVDPECSANCQGGCCDGSNECQSGNSVDACGSSGEACTTCGPNSICSDGECVLDPASRWDLIIENAEVPDADQNGDGWDGRFGGLPEPYIHVTAGLGTSEERTGQTPNAGSTDFADFESFVIFEDVRADILTAEETVLFRWMDNDPAPNPDDQMSQDVPTRIEERFFDGSLITLTQTETFEGAENSPLVFILRYRLVPSDGVDGEAYDPSSHTVAGAAMCREGGTALMEHTVHVAR